MGGNVRVPFSRGRLVAEQGLLALYRDFFVQMFIIESGMGLHGFVKTSYCNSFENLCDFDLIYNMINL